MPRAFAARDERPAFSIVLGGSHLRRVLTAFAAGYYQVLTNLLPNKAALSFRPFNRPDTSRHFQSWEQCITITLGSKTFRQGTRSAGRADQKGVSK